MKFLLLTMSIFLLSACATKYQSSGFTGGFEDTELSPGYYRITFRGNGVTSSERVGNFALLRGAELAKLNGCKNFQVLNNKDSIHSTYANLPQTQTTNANAYMHGNYISGSATTTTYGGGVERINRAKTTLDIRCTSDEVDPNRGVYDTEFIISKLKDKYGIKN